MKIFDVVHSAPVHLAILRGSALLVPAQRRKEWLSEWKTELWYAWQECPPSGRKNITSFCLGAFSDALSLRRNSPLPRFYGSLLIDVEQTFPDPPPSVAIRYLRSPVACLSLLGLLAAFGISVAFLLPTARRADRQVFLDLLTLFAAASLIVPATTSLSFGDYPTNRNWPRRWIFFALKLALVCAIVILGALDVASIGSSISPIRYQIAFWGGLMSIRWAFLDQRRRCPVCLRQLANPVRMGDRSRIFLEWNGTELLCLRGHGLLHVPENPAIWFSRQRWLDLGPSWSRFFLK